MRSGESNQDSALGCAAYVCSTRSTPRADGRIAVNIALPVVAGGISTAIFAVSALPMLIKAVPPKDKTSYSLGSIVLSNVGNVFHSIYVVHLPAGPLWALHSFYLVSTALMLVWYLRYAPRRGRREVRRSQRRRNRRRDRGRTCRRGSLLTAHAGASPDPPGSVWVPADFAVVRVGSVIATAWTPPRQCNSGDSVVTALRRQRRSATTPSHSPTVRRCRSRTLSEAVAGRCRRGGIGGAPLRVRRRA
jgi:hypothetical protein